MCKQLIIDTNIKIAQRAVYKEGRLFLSLKKLSVHSNTLKTD